MQKPLTCLLVLAAVALLPATSRGQMDIFNTQSISYATVQFAGQGALYDRYTQGGNTSYNGESGDTQGSETLQATTSLNSSFSGPLASLQGSVTALQDSPLQEVMSRAFVTVYGYIDVLSETPITLSLSGIVDGNNTTNTVLYAQILVAGVVIASLSSSQSIDTSIDLLLEPGTLYSFAFHFEADKTFTQSGTGAYGMSVTGATASITTTTAVPEPSTWALLALAGAALFAARRCPRD